MYSKLSFDLDHSNNPVVKIEVTSSLDVRDKIAKRFTESFAHGSSQWCEILPTGDNEYWIWPIKPEELREKAKLMLLRADELERGREKYKQHVESV